MKTIRLLSKRDLEQVLTLGDVIQAVEDGFRADAEGDVTTFPVVMEHIAAHDAFFGIKSSFVPATEALGVKVAGFWPPPKDSIVPGHFAVIVYLDGKTGTVLAFMDGDLITTLRTGAAGAVAAKYLARPDSATVGVIGAGLPPARAVLPAIDSGRPHAAIAETGFGAMPSGGVVAIRRAAP